MSGAVRVEGDAFSDIRYEILATACRLADADHARGKMLRLWRQCTLSQSYILSPMEVRVVLGEAGPDALVEARLGEVVREGIRICGTEGRIEWLARLRDNSRKGGYANAAKWLANTDPDSKPPGKPDGYPAAKPDTGPDAKPEHSPLSPSPSPTTREEKNPPIPPTAEREAGALPHTTAIGLLPQPSCVARGTKAKAKRASCTPEEFETVERVLEQLTRRSGVKYRVSDNHVRLVLGRLRDGVTEHDMRCIAGYVWNKSGLGWCDATNAQGVPMRRVYRPETLYGPQTIDRYLDAARTWFSTTVEPNLSDEERQARARASVPVNGHRVRPSMGKA